MYAIVEDSGRQFRVSEGDTLEVDPRNLAEGQDTILFDRVLVIEDGDNSVIGRPFVAGAKVTGKVEGMVKGEKLIIQHFKRRKDSRTKTGHRQKYLRIRIEKIACEPGDSTPKR